MGHGGRAVGRFEVARVRPRIVDRLAELSIELPEEIVSVYPQLSVSR